MSRRVLNWVLAWDEEGETPQRGVLYGEDAESSHPVKMLFDSWIDKYEKGQGTYLITCCKHYKPFKQSVGCWLDELPADHREYVLRCWRKTPPSIDNYEASSMWEAIECVLWVGTKSYFLQLRDYYQFAGDRELPAIPAVSSPVPVPSAPSQLYEPWTDGTFDEGQKLAIKVKGSRACMAISVVKGGVETDSCNHIPWDDLLKNYTLWTGAPCGEPAKLTTAPKPPPACKPWTAETFPSDKVMRVRHKDEHSEIWGMVTDVWLNGVTLHGDFVAYDVLLHDYIQHDGTPCGELA